MRARSWVIAYRYSDPVDHGIPAIPEWDVSRTDSNGLALAADSEPDPFISAEHPRRVRR